MGLKDEVIFLFVGTLLWLKGVADIIEAASVLPGDVDLVCIFAGREEPRDRDGGTIPCYLDIARQLGVERRVKLLGALAPEELARIYQVSDVVVLPTRRDMFPKVLVEGGLAGKPLITTSANGAAGTIVLDGENGFIVEPGDVGGLARAMEALLDEPLRKRMGMRSRELTETFS